MNRRIITSQQIIDFGRTCLMPYFRTTREFIMTRELRKRPQDLKSIVHTNFFCKIMLQNVVSTWCSRQGGNLRTKRQDEKCKRSGELPMAKTIVVAKNEAEHIEQELPGPRPAMVQRRLQRTLSRDSFSTFTTAAETPRTISSGSTSSDKDLLPTEIIIPHKRKSSQESECAFRSRYLNLSSDFEGVCSGSRMITDDDLYLRHYESMEENMLRGSSMRRSYQNREIGSFGGSRLEI